MTHWTPDPRDLDEVVALGRASVAGGSPTSGEASPSPGPTAAGPFAQRARFGRWDGSQLVPDVSADEIIDALTDDVIADGDVNEALRRLLERGWRSSDRDRPDLPGLAALRERLRARRDDVLNRYNLGDVLGDVRAELDAIVEGERTRIEERLEETAGNVAAPTPELGELLRQTIAKRLDRLEALPPDVGDRIRALEEYDFLDSEARERFEALVERLRRSVLDRYAAGMADAVRTMSPEDLAANRAMVRDLDQLLQQQLAGTEPDPGEFLAKHGSFFPGATTVEEIIEQLAQRMSAMQSLLRSLTAAQRSELNSLVDGLLRDDRLRWDLAQLAATLDQVLPDGLGDRFRFGGQEELGLEGALGQLETLGRLETLGGQLDEIG
ncbi:MAG: hypothetical protein ACRDGI_10005 [Candidatus Limnocylindrales bacterium]